MMVFMTVLHLYFDSHRRETVSYGVYGIVTYGCRTETHLQRTAQTLRWRAQADHPLARRHRKHRRGATGVCSPIPN